MSLVDAKDSVPRMVRAKNPGMRVLALSNNNQRVRMFVASIYWLMGFAARTLKHELWSCERNPSTLARQICMICRIYQPSACAGVAAPASLSELPQT